MIGTDYTCRAIGVVRTPFSDPAAAPIQAAFSTGALAAGAVLRRLSETKEGST